MSELDVGGVEKVGWVEGAGDACKLIVISLILYISRSRSVRKIVILSKSTSRESCLTPLTHLR